MPLDALCNARAAFVTKYSEEAQNGACGGDTAEVDGLESSVVPLYYVH